MRLFTVAVVLVFSLALLACGTQETSEPLILEQRVVGADGAPGSEPDPEETQVTATGLEELEAELAGPEVFDEDIAEQQVEDIAEELHARIEGAPLPEPS